MISELTYEEKRRKDMVLGLRNLANFIENNPDVKLPYSFSEYVYIDNTEHVRNEDVPERDDDGNITPYADRYTKIAHPELDKSEVAAAAKSALRYATKIEKDYSGDNFRLEAHFSDRVQVTWQTARDSVCTKRVVGFETREKAHYERIVDGTEEVEVYEYDCDPLLK